MTFLQIFTRGIFFIIVAALWYFYAIWLAIPCVVMYAYRYKAYELSLLGLLLDMQFRTNGVIPYYTLIFLGLILFAEWLKPQLRARYDSYEME